MSDENSNTGQGAVDRLERALVRHFDKTDEWQNQTRSIMSAEFASVRKEFGELREEVARMDERMSGIRSVRDEVHVVRSEIQGVRQDQGVILDRVVKLENETAFNKGRDRVVMGVIGFVAGIVGLVIFEVLKGIGRI